jgi:predicted nucleotidyltransferase
MDLSSPISSVIPSAHGVVLVVLARTTEPLSGRKVAELTNGKVSQKQANNVLGELSEAGVVLRESRPPAKLYRLNRDHVAADGILALTEIWGRLVQRIRDEISLWGIPALSACLFGSAARGEASTGSDIDVLLVRRGDGSSSEEGEQQWQDQVDRLTERVTTWSGNPCEVLELTPSELQAATLRDDRLARDLRRDAILLVGVDVRDLLRQQEG